MPEVTDINIADLDDRNIKILTYGMLKDINASSVKAKRNRNVYFHKLPIKDDGTIYPITMSFVHNDKEVRTQILLSMAGKRIDLDMSFEEFGSLPTYAEFEEILERIRKESDGR